VTSGVRVIHSVSNWHNRIANWAADYASDPGGAIPVLASCLELSDRQIAGTVHRVSLYQSATV
jgi:hypothetical protein